jgi:hypothetical protein
VPCNPRRRERQIKMRLSRLVTGFKLEVTERIAELLWIRAP